MKVLLTGGLGNIGLHALQSLLDNGHEVRCFEVDTAATREQANAYRDNARVEIFWGDIRNRESVANALPGMDAIIHIAAIIPPLSEIDTDLSQAVNVTGTNNLIEAMQQSGAPKRIVFASSTAVHGSDLSRTPPLRSDAPYNPEDLYAQQKVENESALMESSLDWTICRVAATPPLNPLKARSEGNDQIMFGMPVEARIEALHTADCGLAFANAVSCDEAIGKVLFLAGGRDNGCQVSGYEFVTAMFTGVGIGALPREAFSKDPSGAHADWCDTEESQRLLRYQRHSLQDMIVEMKANTGWRYYAIRLVSPLIRRAMLKKSPHYNT